MNQRPDPQSTTEWPAPPYYRYAHAQDAALPADCTILRHDGQQRVGQLVRFLPAQNALEFLPPDRPTSVLVDFGSIRSLRLTRPVVLAHRELEQFQNADVIPPEQPQSFKVKFRGGEEESGHTRGFVTEKYGLFLYPTVDESRVVRLFAPAKATLSDLVASYQMREAAQEHMLPETAEELEIRAWALGRDAGVLGAVGVALQRSDTLYRVAIQS